MIKERQVFNLNKWIEQVFFQRQVAKMQRRKETPEPFAPLRLRGFALKKEIRSPYLRASPKHFASENEAILPELAKGVFLHTIYK